MLCFLVSKKKTKEKSKTSGVDAASPDFDSSPLTKGLGQPLQGQPLNEEMIVMAGNSDLPPSLPADSGETKRDDL